MGCKARTERVVEFGFENQLPCAPDLKTKGEKSSHAAHRVCIYGSVPSLQLTCSPQITTQAGFVLTRRMYTIHSVMTNLSHPSNAVPTEVEQGDTLPSVFGAHAVIVSPAWSI